MTRNLDIPSDAHVRQPLAAQRVAGRRPTAAGTARELGLTNSTFWRHFRDIAWNCKQLPSPAPPPTQSPHLATTKPGYAANATSWPSN
jgi:hypothetical protein